MSELDDIDRLLAALDEIARTAPTGKRHDLWDCTVAAWAAGAIRELMAKTQVDGA